MKLYFYCSSFSCKKENSLRVKSSNRYDLKNEIGEEINRRCSHCGKHTERHINRLNAKPNYVVIAFGFLAAVIITIALWNLGFISTLSGAIPIAIWMYEERRASNFNKIMI